MSDFNYNSNHTFYRFYKEYDEFEGISTESNYDKMKDFNKLLIKFKSLKTRKTETQFEKERMLTKNVDQLYKNNYDANKSGYDTDDELTDDKKKKFDYKQFEIDDEINKGSKLDEKTKQFGIIDNRDQGTKSTKKENTETKKPDEIHMPLWVTITRKGLTH